MRERDKYYPSPGLYRNGVWLGTPELPCDAHEGDIVVGAVFNETAGEPLRGRWMSVAEYRRKFGS